MSHWNIRTTPSRLRPPSQEIQTNLDAASGALGIQFASILRCLSDVPAQPSVKRAEVPVAEQRPTLPPGWTYKSARQLQQISKL